MFDAGQFMVDFVPISRLEVDILHRGYWMYIVIPQESLQLPVTIWRFILWILFEILHLTFGILLQKQILIAKEQKDV